MNREEIIAHMQKPARILRVICSILFVLAIIGTAVLTIVQMVLPFVAESTIALLDDPQVEQTQEVRDTIALLSEYAGLPAHVTGMLTVYTLMGGITSVLMYLFLKRLFASLSEERYSILRTEYANGIQSVAIVMLVSAAIEAVFPAVIALMDANAAAISEGASTGLLVPGLFLLAVSFIYRYACRLQLLNEQEAFENFRAGETPYGSENTSDAEAKEEPQAKENTPFEGF